MQTITLSKLELLVVHAALCAYRVETKNAVEANGNKAEDNVMYDLIRRTELNVLEQATD